MRPQHYAPAYESLIEAEMSKLTYYDPAYDRRGFVRGLRPFRAGSRPPRDMLALSALSHGLVPGAHRVSRRDGLTAAAATAASLLPVSRSWAVDELDEDDPDNYAGIVGSASGMKKRTKPGDKAASLKATAADVKEAFADITTARTGLAQVQGLLDKGDFAGVAKLLAAPPFSSAKASLSTIVRGPTLGVEEKKAIGNEKRFGTGADVLIMLGGLNEAANAQDAAAAKSYLTKARHPGSSSSRQRQACPPTARGGLALPHGGPLRPGQRCGRLPPRRAALEPPWRAPPKRRASRFVCVRRRTCRRGGARRPSAARLARLAGPSSACGRSPGGRRARSARRRAAQRRDGALS